jgi:FMN-dependent oxidoreductase (nitrilotriacetate monooxygenase family)
VRVVGQVHLNLNFLNAGTFGGAWRWPISDPAGFYDIDYWIRTAQLAERATFDAVFLADFPALSDNPEFRPFQSLEPTIVLTAIAAATKHVGLIGTASSSYNEPYNIARRFSSLDHVSRGRAGLNIVTTADPASGRNFGAEVRPVHAARYERGAEFAEVVSALWDSWEDGALLGDKAAGRLIDPARIHVINHRGKYFSVAGPLNVPRSPQGRPIVVQAGGSDAGRDLAARHADAVFSVALTLADAEEYSKDLRARAVAHGRQANDILIFPGLVTVIGGSEVEAKRREQELWELLPFEYGLRRLAGTLGVPAESLDLDKPLPQLALPVDGIQTFFKGAVATAQRGNLTARQLIRAQGGGTGHRIVVGTPEQIADGIAEWFAAGFVDGFNVMPDVIASGFDAFAEQVVPLLRRKGIFRERYDGTTLRDHLGLARPERRAAPGETAFGTPTNVTTLRQ